MSSHLLRNAVIQDILNECRRRGIRLRNRGDRIAVIGHRLMTPTLWHAVQQHEAGLIASIEARRVQQASSLFEFRLVGGCWITYITARVTLAAVQEQIERRFGAKSVDAVRIRARRNHQFLVRQ